MPMKSVQAGANEGSFFLKPGVTYAFGGVRIDTLNRDTVIAAALGARSDKILSDGKTDSHNVKRKSFAKDSGAFSTNQVIKSVSSKNGTAVVGNNDGRTLTRVDKFKRDRVSFSCKMADDNALHQIGQPVHVGVGTGDADGPNNVAVSFASNLNQLVPKNKRRIKRDGRGVIDRKNAKIAKSDRISAHTFRDITFDWGFTIDQNSRSTTKVGITPALSPAKSDPNAKRGRNRSR